MGATRLASGWRKEENTNATKIAASFPDARRVAPISACVSSSTKRYHQTPPQNATSNGGDASRVGIEKERKYELC